MDLAYLIVGIAKNEEKDFWELYDHTHNEVFSLALALVKDRVLAREISIETYRRVKKFAGFFDTDMNAEYWILDITKNLCINSLNDKEIGKREGKLDNVSKLLKQLINTKNDRGAIIILRAISNLKMNDIANLLWYYNLSARNEYKRGIKELKKKNPELTNITDINYAIKKDIEYCAPNISEDINTDKSTVVSYISHEAMSIDENTFSGEDVENEYIKRLKDYGKSTRKARYASLILLSLLAIVVVSAVTITIYKNYKKNLANQRYYIGSEIAIVEVEGVVYYQNYKDKSSLYSFDVETKKNKKLCDDFIKELKTDGNSLFYRNKNDSRIYRINLDGSNRTKLTEHAGSSIYVYDDYVYYSSPSGINRMKKDGSENEAIISLASEEIFSYDIVVHNDIIYFSGGAGLGLYYIEKINEENSIRALSIDEIYDIQITDPYIFFNTKTASSKKQATVYKYSFDSKQNTTVTDIFSGSGAYYMSSDNLYMDGYVKSTSGIKKDQGIYKVNIESGQSTLIIPRTSTHIYVSDRYIYSYSPDNNGSLIAYDKNDYNIKIIIF